MSTGSSQDMTLNESIDYLNNLINKYSEAERLEEQITDNENTLRDSLELNYKRYSFFRFFWPYLIIAPLIGYTVLMITYMIDAINYNEPLCFSIAFIATIIALIIGSIIAGKLCHRNNANIDEHNKSTLKKRERIEQDTAVLKSALEDKKNEFEKASAILPENLRNGSAVTQMQTFLQSGTASSLQEAIDILRDSF